MLAGVKTRIKRMTAGLGRVYEQPLRPGDDIRACVLGFRFPGQNLKTANAGECEGYYLMRLDGHYKFLTESGRWLTCSEIVSGGEKKRLYKKGGIIPPFIFRGYNLTMVPSLRYGRQFYSNRLIAHALGGYNGRTYRNTRAALMNAYDKGFRYFETDIALVGGRVPVLSHRDYEDMEAFIADAQGEGEMTFDELLSFAKEHEDAVFELDLHMNDIEVKMEVMRDAVLRTGVSQDRFLVQANKFGCMEEMPKDRFFRFYQAILRARWLSEDKIDEAVDFCLKNGIIAAGVREDHVTGFVADVIHTAGLELMSYTVDDPGRIRELYGMGVSSVCTNFVKPEEI